MSVKSTLRSLIPYGIWQTAGFCKRLPSYWRMNRSESLRVRKGFKGLPIFVTSEVFVSIPESLTAYMCWRSHAIEDPSSSVETTDFLELASGRASLIDIGAQTGFMSALFARAQPTPIRILSLEPDPQVHSILERARELNSRPGVDWTIWHEAASNTTGTSSIQISNTLHESRESEFGKQIQVQSRTLEDIVQRVGWNPDILKIDVESFEYEIVTSSLPLLAKLKPALQLEVHWELLKSRGLDARRFLGPLADMGYRGIRSRYRGLLEWNRAGKTETVTRLSLCAD